MTPAFGLLAPIAMMLNGFVQPVVRARNAALAIVAISAQERRSSEHQKAKQRRCGECRFPEERIVQTMSHRCSFLPDRFLKLLVAPTSATQEGTRRLGTYINPYDGSFSLNLQRRGNRAVR